ncbi:MAG: VanZ family protein [bacterium]
MKIKLVAFLGFSFLLYLLWAADSGHLPRFASSIYHFPNGDKIGHFGLYGMVAFFLALAFPRVCHVKHLRIPIVIASFLIFSVAEEWSQSLFFRRNADPIDALCSCAGILVGTWAAYWVRKSRKCQ